ncbi:MAG TPA: hypothetical protein VKU00_32435 [Chthonomonadaceae bacterium]|nr:hypothetical protein [Chthonomonadaceae bacterium]
MFLCEDLPHEATTRITTWITQSRRFYAFALDNRSKIRKKLRTAVTPESLQSTLLELEVAHYFLADRRCLVEYERYGLGKGRSPDLTVTFRARTLLNLEVTLVKDPTPETPQWEGKLIGIVCDKLGQMPPESLNVLVASAERGSLTLEEVAQAMQRLKERIEKREGELLSRWGFAVPADFFKQFQRLSGIVVWQREEHAMGEGKGLWVNPQARRPLPTEIVALLKA